jgi:probable F420-dependent oxidoreductase
MTGVQVGTYGAVVAPTADGPELVDTAVALEELGFSTIWLTGGPLTSLDQVADVVRGTKSVTVATGILAVVTWASEDVAALYTDLEKTHPGRFVVGLGGAHGPDPVRTLESYLGRLTAVPQSRRVLAALGPRMYRMAREHAAGALPVLVTPERTAEARQLLGPDTTLAVEQLLVLETDPDRAREIGRGPLKFLATMPAYQANFRRMGFSDDDIASLGDRLVDALVPWGTPDAIAAHVAAQRAAGADHVALSVVSAGNAPSLAEWRTLAAAVLP